MQNIQIATIVRTTIAIPPPLGIGFWCELRSLGISSIFFLSAHARIPATNKYEAMKIKTPAMNTKYNDIVLSVH